MADDDAAAMRAENADKLISQGKRKPGPVRSLQAEGVEVMEDVDWSTDDPCPFTLTRDNAAEKLRERARLFMLEAFGQVDVWFFDDAAGIIEEMKAENKQLQVQLAVMTENADRLAGRLEEWCGDNPYDEKVLSAHRKLRGA